MVIGSKLGNLLHILAELENNKAEVTYISLSEKNILPCKGCYACQNVSDEYGCIQQDDVLEIMEKIIAIIATHGYDAEYGAGPFETGIKRLCEHSNLEYMGMYSARDEDNLASFQTEDVMNGARIFARTLLTK